MKHIYSWD